MRVGERLLACARWKKYEKHYKQTASQGVNMRNIDQIKRDMCLCIGAVIADKGWDDEAAAHATLLSIYNVRYVKSLNTDRISVSTLVRAMNAIGYTASLTITRGV